MTPQRVLVLCFVLISTTTTAFAARTARRDANNLTVMTYNVGNLFNTIHDEQNQDWTYLPLAIKLENPQVQDYCRSLQYPYKTECFTLDWSENTLKLKLQQIARMIREGNAGRGADIIVLEEVENRDLSLSPKKQHVLHMLMSTYLKDSGYTPIMHTEGGDKRGINVAMLSRYPLMGTPVNHPLSIEVVSPKDGRKRKVTTRGILEASFQVGTKKVTVFGNHWPSPAAPPEARYQAAEQFYEIALKADADLVLAAGDFNTKKSESPNGLKDYVMNNRRKLSFYDAEAEFRKRGLGANEAPGTHYYDRKWESLDHVFVAKEMNGFEPSWESLDIVNPAFAMKDARGESVPRRFAVENGVGIGASDHLPIFVSFRRKN